MPGSSSNLKEVHAGTINQNLTATPYNTPLYRIRSRNVQLRQLLLHHGISARGRFFEILRRAIVMLLSRLCRVHGASAESFMRNQTVVNNLKLRWAPRGNQNIDSSAYLTLLDNTAAGYWRCSSARSPRFRAWATTNPLGDCRRFRPGLMFSEFAPRHDFRFTVKVAMICLQERKHSVARLSQLERCRDHEHRQDAGHGLGAIAQLA